MGVFQIRLARRGMVSMPVPCLRESGKKINDNQKVNYAYAA